MKLFLKGLGVLFILGMLMVGCAVWSGVSWFTGRAVEVVKQEIDPAALQRKYEWFKDASAQLDAKMAGLGTYRGKIARLRTLDNQGRLDRTNREQLMIWEQEQQGMKLSYNELAAEYNSQMVKWNYKFTNVGELPKGATQPLPREYKPYIEE